MRKILVVQHDPHEGPGTFAEAATRAGYDLDVRRVYAGESLADALPRAAAMVLMGGPMNVDEWEAYPFLEAVHRVLQEALRRDMPLLGFCLGSQLIAKAAGARVLPAAVQEIGWYDVRLTAAGAEDPVLHDGDNRLPVFQWHGDTFELPDGATLLCTADRVPHQAFRLGDTAYGFQFHLEVTAAMIDTWLDVHRAELAAMSEPVDPGAIRAAAPERLPAMHQAGAMIFDRWFARLGRTT